MAIPVASAASAMMTNDRSMDSGLSPPRSSWNGWLKNTRRSRSVVITDTTEPKVAIDCQWARCDSTLEVSRVKFSGTFDWWGRCDSCGGQHQISAGDEVTGTIRPLAKVIAGDLLDSDELAGLLGVAPSSLRAMRAQPIRHRSIDGLPEPIRTIGNAPVWDRVAVANWLATKA